MTRTSMFRSDRSGREERIRLTALRVQLETYGELAVPAVRGAPIRDVQLTYQWAGEGRNGVSKRERRNRTRLTPAAV